MRFTFKLYSKKLKPAISFNFQESFSRGISKILASEAENFDALMASEAYYKPGMLKDFRDFSFSEIHCQFVSKEGRMSIAGDDIRITICFQLPAIASDFIREVFLNKSIVIGDDQWNGIFTIGEIFPFRYFLKDAIQEIKVIAASPVVVEWKKPDGESTFIGPTHPEFSKLLLSNWREKYKRIYGSSKSLLDFLPSEITTVLNNESPVKSRSINIIPDDQKTGIRGYMNFQLILTGTKDALELILNTGIGKYNYYGMGCITTIHTPKPTTNNRQKRTNYNRPATPAKFNKPETTEDFNNEISRIFKKFSK